MGFGLLGKEFSSFSKSFFSVVPFSYEGTTSYIKGTSKGPKALLKSSHHLELFDEQFRINPAEKGIFTFPITDKKEIAQLNMEKSLGNNKFPVMIGGEHSITSMVFGAVQKRFGKMNCVVFDAHADIKDKYSGERESHACVSRRLYEKTGSVAILGVRSLDEEEDEFISGNRIPVYYAHEQDSDKALKVANSLDPRLPTYVSFDLDGLDPSIMPGTGTPEPGGLSWHESISILESVFRRYNVVACDCVELMPLKGSIVSEFTAAKLAYKMMALRSRK